MSAGFRLEAAVESVLGEPVAAASAVTGGSINDAWRCRLASGRSALVKSRDGATAGEFEAEAAGLRWLAQGGAQVPAVLGTHARPPLIALEWIEAGTLSRRGAEELGRRLAALHRSGADGFGSLAPGAPEGRLMLGSLALSLTGASSWTALYREQLLAPLASAARDRGSLSSADADAVDRLGERLDRVCGAAEPPARLHGDLWSGNVLADAAGAAWLTDPAAYGGHREVDLAMLSLFGSPSPRVFAAYDEAYPLADGHSERTELWQLLPLLVHAVLFGGSYGAAAGRAARRYL